MSSPTYFPTYLTAAPTDIEDNPDPNNLPKPPPEAEEPTYYPTYLTYDPTAMPSAKPVAPTKKPTVAPTNKPTNKPKQNADPSPTFYPTFITEAPTRMVEIPAVPAKEEPVPTIEPTYFPTIEPTYLTYAPTKLQPTVKPTQKKKQPEPTIEPTYLTYAPTNDEPMPTFKPTKQSTLKPANPNAVIKKDKYGRQLVGFQSNWGSAHPGSMAYDFTRNSIYITGTNFEAVQNKANDVDFKRSTCFVGELPMADIQDWRADEKPKPSRAGGNFVVPDDFSEREVMGCSSIFFDDASASETLYVGTVTDPDATARKGSINAGVNAYERARNNPEWKLDKQPFDLHDSAEIHTPVRWPVAMTSAKRQDADIVTVLSVGSDDNLLTEEYIENGDANNKNNLKNSMQLPHLGGDPNKYAVPKRGSNFFLSYQRYKVTAGKFEFEGGEDIREKTQDSEIVPTGLGNLRPRSEEFIFSGTTKGIPPSRFRLSRPLTANGDPRNADYDGFVTGIKFPQTRPSFIRERNVRFQSIESNPALDDFAHGLCLPPPGPNGDVDTFYVVGSSFGTMSPGFDQTEITTNILSGLNELEDGNKVNRLSAWISKIDTTKNNQNSVVWTTQLFATPDNISLEGGMTEAFGCHVIDQDESKLYLGGTVYNGGTMDSNQKSGGGDDVWVAQLDTADGALRWIKQIGSKGDDRLAKTNGIEVDVNGHAIIFGETNGELYRRRRGKVNQDDGSSTDIFVTTLDKADGATESTIGQDRMSTVKKDAIIGTSITAVLVMLLLALGYLLKWRRAQKYAAKETDGVLTAGKFAGSFDSDPGANFATGEHSLPPPSQAFTDSTSNGGGEGDDNGDASGGLSKFV